MGYTQIIQGLRFKARFSFKFSCLKGKYKSENGDRRNLYLTGYYA